MKNFHSGNINLIIKIFIWQVMEQGSSNLYQQPIHAQKKSTYAPPANLGDALGAYCIGIKRNTMKLVEYIKTKCF
jgi:hypothetical protein